MNTLHLLYVAISALITIGTGIYITSTIKKLHSSQGQNGTADPSAQAHESTDLTAITQSLKTLLDTAERQEKQLSTLKHEFYIDNEKRSNEQNTQLQERFERLTESVAKRLEEQREQQRDLLHTLQTSTNKQISESLEQLNRSTSQSQTNLSKSLLENLELISKSNTESTRLLQQSLTEKLDGQKEMLTDLQIKLLKDNIEAQGQTQQTLQAAIDQLQKANTEKLEQIEKTNSDRLQQIEDNVNKKLDTSLNERLDRSFSQVSEQLSTLHKNLGELQDLSVNVSSLHRTLSNVKVRGMYGELQLENLLSSILDKSQYSQNVQTKLNSMDFVEFAVKIPDKEIAGNYIYLPIDAKFPAEPYQKLIDACENADKTAIQSATKELENRIKAEAKTIADKYIDPPRTTDFAIMFLPLESMYAEVIRINGLLDWCREHKVIITGPTTLVAIINSLSVGFKYLTVNKNSREVLNTLSAVKAQCSKFTELIEKTQKKLAEAQKATDALSHRNELMVGKLKKVETMNADESCKILGITEQPPSEA